MVATCINGPAVAKRDIEELELPHERQRTRIAVLIDADNASPRHAEALMVEIAKLGEAIVRRIYGDFSTPNLKGWNDKLARHALKPVQAVAYRKGKNTSDISLVLDAMDLMHTGVYDAFCLVSSDSDFTGLAQRLRESGAEVYGFGEAKTPESFRQSCRRFFLIENLAREQAEADGSAAAVEPELELRVEQPVRPASEALATIAAAYRRHQGDHADGWVPIRTLQRTIANVAADFDPRTYGEARLGDLAERTGAYEVKHLADRKWSIRAKAPRRAASGDAGRRFDQTRKRGERKRAAPQKAPQTRTPSRPRATAKSGKPGGERRDVDNARAHDDKDGLHRMLAHTISAERDTRNEGNAK